MKTRVRKITVWVISLLMGTLFLYAAFMKLYSYHDFLIQLSKSPYTTGRAYEFGWMIPATELLIVLILVKPDTRIAGLYASFALMLLFTTYIYSILHFSYYIPCSCGGILEKMTWEQHLRFNIVFTILPAIAVLLYPRHRIQPQHHDGVHIIRANTGKAENLAIE